MANMLKGMAGVNYKTDHQDKADPYEYAIRIFCTPQIEKSEFSGKNIM
jgi:hypothetical protein